MSAMCTPYLFLEIEFILFINVLLLTMWLINQIIHFTVAFAEKHTHRATQ